MKVRYHSNLSECNINTPQGRKGLLRKACGHCNERSLVVLIQIGIVASCGAVSSTPC